MLEVVVLQVKGSETVSLPALHVAEADRILAARTAVIGHSRVVSVDWLIYVVPALYGELPVRDRYDVAALLGRVNRALPPPERQTAVLLGPGRWGTGSPSLGIPVAFSDVNHVSVLCEIVAMHKDLIPDVSLGTHFLNELVEMDMLYVALFPNQGENYLNEALLRGAPSHLLQLVPDAGRWQDAVRVLRAGDLSPAGRPVQLVANAMEQKADCFFEGPGPVSML